MPDRREIGEIWIDDTPPASVVFAEYSCVADNDGNPLPMLTALQSQFDEYTEIPYRRGELRREVGMAGPRVLVGAYKSAILGASVNWLQHFGHGEPMPLSRSIDACHAAAPFDLTGVELFAYVRNPKADAGDKTRLAYIPDFGMIDELYDPERPEAWIACKAFYESHYAVQRFAAGIRSDIYGGSSLVPPKPSWENKHEVYEPPIPGSSATHRFRLLGGGLLDRLHRRNRSSV